ATWIEPEQNPWGVRLLDVERVLAGAISTSRSPEQLQNALSFHREELGASFVGVEPEIKRETQLNLVYRRKRPLMDGVLFGKPEMEKKWALFVYRNEIIFVRTWRRLVVAIAQVEQTDDRIFIKNLRGDLVEGCYLGPINFKLDQSLVCDFLIRS